MVEATGVFDPLQPSCLLQCCYTESYPGILVHVVPFSPIQPGFLLYFFLLNKVHFDSHVLARNLVPMPP